MKRRTFIRLMATACAAGLAGLWTAGRNGVRRVTRAVRSAHFPGQVRAWNARRTGQPSRWAG